MLRKAYHALNTTLSSLHPWLNETVMPSGGSRTFDKNLRIAVVKQVTAPSLFCTPPSASPQELLESAFKHTGVIGLATRFRTDFLIVDTTDDPETQIWKEVFTDPAHGSSLAACEALRTEPLMKGARGHNRSPGEFMRKVEEIDWSAYDIVLSVNVAVPTRVLQKFPRVTWAYMIDHPVTPTFRRSETEGPLFGYDAFLSIRFRRLRTLPRRNAAGVIDWPFNIQYYGVFHDVLGQPRDDSWNREGIFVESHSEKVLTAEQKAELSQFGTLRFVSPRTIDIVRDLLRSKYYVRLGGRLLWGNSQIEAIAAGCLYLGDPRESVNKSLFTRRSSVRDFPSLIDSLRSFEAVQTFYREECAKQRRLLDHICFERPLEELLALRQSKLAAK